MYRTAIAAMILLAGCTSTPIDTLPGRVGLRVAGTPSVTDRSFSVWVWLEGKAPGTIQTVTVAGEAWTGTEWHPQPMFRPDWHTMSRGDPQPYYRRDMRVRQGEVAGVSIAPWGVALLHGWPEHFNRTTQRFVGQQGRIVSEKPETETLWRIELWGLETPPRLRVTCLDTGDYAEWAG